MNEQGRFRFGKCLGTKLKHGYVHNSNNSNQRGLMVALCREAQADNLENAGGMEIRMTILESKECRMKAR